MKKNEKMSNEQKNKISQTKERLYAEGKLIPWNKGKKGLQIAWNKGLINIYSKKTLERMSKSHEGEIPWNKGIPRTETEKKKIGNRPYPVGDKHYNYGKPPASNVGRGKRSYYKSPLQGEVCFRSSYELLYAKYLDKNKILWMYEMETFDLGDTTYTPDFFLPKFEKFIEIKGYMSKIAQYKINKFLEQYPWNLEILYKKDLIREKII